MRQHKHNLSFFTVLYLLGNVKFDWFPESLILLRALFNLVPALLRAP